MAVRKAGAGEAWGAWAQACSSEIEPVGVLEACMKSPMNLTASSRIDRSLRARSSRCELPAELPATAPPFSWDDTAGGASASRGGGQRGSLRRASEGGGATQPRGGQARGSEVGRAHLPTAVVLREQHNQRLGARSRPLSLKPRDAPGKVHHAAPGVPSRRALLDHFERLEHVDDVVCAGEGGGGDWPEASHPAARAGAPHRSGGGRRQVTRRPPRAPRSLRRFRRRSAAGNCRTVGPVTCPSGLRRLAPPPPLRLSPAPRGFPRRTALARRQASRAEGRLRSARSGGRRSGGRRHSWPWAHSGEVTQSRSFSLPWRVGCLKSPEYHCFLLFARVANRPRSAV